MKALTTCYISFRKLLFSYWVQLLYFFHETVNSNNLERANHIAQVIFVFHSAMKTHLLTNQNARTIQIIL